MQFRELNNEQRRYLIDTDQIYNALRQTDRKFRLSYKGSMRWKKIKGKEYLYRYIDGRHNSMGPRSQETEKLKEQYTSARRRLRDRKNNLKKRLDEKARVLRGLGLGRLDPTLARILRKLDEQNLLGKSLTVVGTNALFAYEMLVGVHFQTELLTTEDADLLWDMRRGLGVAGSDFTTNGLIGLLRKVDSSFKIESQKSFRAYNKDGYYVDLIVPENKQYMMMRDDRMVPSVEDLYGAPIKGLDWLVNSPKIEATVIDTSGHPLYMSCVDPRVFALHKLWMSKQEDRHPFKKNRDREQAMSVAALVNTYMLKKFRDTDLKSLPKHILDLKDELNVKGGGYLISEQDAGW